MQACIQILHFYYVTQFTHSTHKHTRAHTEIDDIQYSLSTTISFKMQHRIEQINLIKTNDKFLKIVSWHSNHKIGLFFLTLPKVISQLHVVNMLVIQTRHTFSKNILPRSSGEKKSTQFLINAFPHTIHSYSRECHKSCTASVPTLQRESSLTHEGGS